MGLGVGLSGLDCFSFVKTIASVMVIAISIRMMTTSIMISRRFVELSSRERNVTKFRKEIPLSFIFNFHVL